MQLTKMKRCQKAIYGYKGVLTGEDLFNEVDQLKAILGAPILVETAKYPGVKIPSYFIILETATASRWGGGGGAANACNFKIYVNDAELLPALDGIAPVEATA
jgi:hypothetical protein